MRALIIAVLAVAALTACTTAEKSASGAGLGAVIGGAATGGVGGAIAQEQGTLDKGLRRGGVDCRAAGGPVPLEHATVNPGIGTLEGVDGSRGVEACEALDRCTDTDAAAKVAVRHVVVAELAAADDG